MTNPDAPDTPPEANTATTGTQPPAKQTDSTFQPITINSPEALAALLAQHAPKADTSQVEALTERANRAEQAASTATEQLHSTLKRSAIIDAALAAGCIDPDTVATLAAGNVTINQNGEPEGASGAVATLKQSKPHLFRPAGAGSRDASAHTPPSGGFNMDNWIRGLA